MSEDCPRCMFNATEIGCHGCFEGSHYKPKPFTNADRIRSMSDGELAEWFASQYNDCDLCPDYIYAGNCPDGCKKKWLDWLRQEAEE